MNDQMIPADKVRKIIARYRDGANDQGGRILADLKDMPPPHPTLADMALEERDACQWMQADLNGYGNRVVILNPGWDDGSARVMWTHTRVGVVPQRSVTPRPDLPRMEWPGEKKPAPAPALPAGWRIADHQKYGRVIVTRPEPDADGEVVVLCPDQDMVTRAALVWCTNNKLTYIDTEPDADQCPPTKPATCSTCGARWGER